MADAALALAAETDWRRVTLRTIAQRAAVSLTDLYGVVRSKADILDELARRFDRAAVNELDLDPGASARERVFDAAMARFDAMEPHRAGLAPILQAATGDLGSAARGFLSLKRSARWLLELAGVSTDGLAGVARVQGFTPILGRAGRAWLKDEGGDLSLTMRQLDRDLRDVVDWGERLKWPRKKPDDQKSAGPGGPDSDGPEPINPAG